MKAALCDQYGPPEVVHPQEQTLFLRMVGSLQDSVTRVGAEP